MIKYREWGPEEIKEFVAKIKLLITPPPSDFEKYLIDDTLTWHIEAGETVDPAEVRAAVRRYLRARQSNKYSADRNEDPPPTRAGGDRENVRSDLDIWKDVFGED